MKLSALAAEVGRHVTLGGTLQIAGVVAWGIIAARHQLGVVECFGIGMTFGGIVGIADQAREDVRRDAMRRPLNGTINTRDDTRFHHFLEDDPDAVIEHLLFGARPSAESE